MRKFSFS